MSAMGMTIQMDAAVQTTVRMALHGRDVRGDWRGADGEGGALLSPFLGRTHPRLHSAIVRQEQSLFSKSSAFVELSATFRVLVIQ